MSHTQQTSTAPPATRTEDLVDAPGVRRSVLPSGLRVVTEHMPGVRSAAVGVWVGVGSVDEDDALHGCSHFLEHLLFKGTRSRSALDISIALDTVGGEFNAFTAKEYTCFHARVLDEDLPLEEMLKMIPAQRMGTPEEVAGAVNFLMSAEAGYITRQVLAVNGGLC